MKLTKKIIASTLISLMEAPLELIILIKTFPLCCRIGVILMKICEAMAIAII